MGQGISHFLPGVAGRFRDRAGTDVFGHSPVRMWWASARARDAFDRERNKIPDVGDAPLVFEKLRQRGSTRETAEASGNRLTDAIPGLARCFGNQARPANRPRSVPLVVPVGPSKDFRQGQPRAMCLAVHAPLPCKKAGQRPPAGQISGAALKSEMNRAPVLARRLVDRSGVDCRPSARPSVECIGPAEDFRKLQRRKVLRASNPAPRKEQPSDRGTARKTAISALERRIQVRPNLFSASNTGPELWSAGRGVSFARDGHRPNPESLPRSIAGDAVRRALAQVIETVRNRRAVLLVPSTALCPGPTSRRPRHPGRGPK